MILNYEDLSDQPLVPSSITTIYWVGCILIIKIEMLRKPIKLLLHKECLLIVMYIPILLKYKELTIFSKFCLQWFHHKWCYKINKNIQLLLLENRKENINILSYIIPFENRIGHTNYIAYKQYFRCRLLQYYHDNYSLNLSKLWNRKTTGFLKHRWQTEIVCTSIPHILTDITGGEHTVFWNVFFSYRITVTIKLTFLIVITTSNDLPNCVTVRGLWMMVSSSYNQFDVRLIYQSLKDDLILEYILQFFWII